MCVETLTHVSETIRPCCRIVTTSPRGPLSVTVKPTARARTGRIATSWKDRQSRQLRRARPLRIEREPQRGTDLALGPEPRSTSGARSELTWITHLFRLTVCLHRSRRGAHLVTVRTGPASGHEDALSPQAEQN